MNHRIGGPSISLDADRVLRVLLVCIGLLLLLSTLTQLLYFRAPRFPFRDGLASLLNVDEERSLPTAFSALLHLACSLCCYLVTQAHRRQALPHVFRWQLMVLFFLLTAGDEWLSLHERISKPLRELLGVGGVLHYAWVIPGFAVVAGLGLFMARAVWNLPPAVRQRVLLAVLLFLAGALGVEMLGGAHMDALDEQVTLAYVPYFTVEEGLEMLGAALFVHALLRYLQHHLGGAQIRLPAPG